MDETIDGASYTYGTDDVDEAVQTILAAVPGALINREFDYGAGLVAGRPDKSGAVIVFKGAEHGRPEIKTPIDQVIEFLRK